MKSILSLIAVCAVVTLAGCQSSKSSSVSPGAVQEKNGACCSDKSAGSCSKGEANTSMGAVGETKSGCCSSKAACTAEKPAMGAVGEKSECTKTCPVTGQTVSPGAVSDAPAKSGCCSGKTSCGGTAKTGG